MQTVASLPLDLVHELRLRCWARENYVPASQRDGNWPGVVQDEMRRRDLELAEAAEQAHGSVHGGRRIVPLMPDGCWTVHGPHVETMRSKVLVSIPVVS